ncbi:Uncharacterised protein [Candidatus Gugararchaeum adminiculabundum]|nr:Uncharacterised protein [Candidatus Gugararchaeum adminiculabundum]
MANIQTDRNSRATIFSARHPMVCAFLENAFCSFGCRIIDNLDLAGKNKSSLMLIEIAKTTGNDREWRAAMKMLRKRASKGDKAAQNYFKSMGRLSEVAK